MNDAQKAKAEPFPECIQPPPFSKTKTIKKISKFYYKESESLLKKDQMNYSKKK